MNAWRIFCEVVRSEGLNAGSERLGCEPSTASRALRALEEALGAPLFSRASRPVTLTELGREAYRRALQLTAQHDDMIASLKGDKDMMAGLIRVSSHAGIGPARITPGLVSFQQIYPDVQFELHEISTGLPEGFCSESGALIDVVLGYGHAGTLPGVVCRHVGEMPFVPVASPLYIRRHGLPRMPEDCRRHTGILISSPTRAATTTLERDGIVETIGWSSTLTVHSLSSAKSAVALGAGIVPDMPLYHCADEIEAGTVVPVLPGWHRRPLSCYVYAREESYAKRRVQEFVEWIAEREREALRALRSRFPAFYAG